MARLCSSKRSLLLQEKKRRKRSHYIDTAGGVNVNRVVTHSFVIPHLERGPEDHDVPGRLVPGLPVHLHRQLAVHVDLDMASLEIKEFVICYSGRDKNLPLKERLTS